MITIDDLQDLFDALHIDVAIIYSEDGDEFQQYVYDDGSPVPVDTAVGLELEDRFVLLPNIYFE